MLTDKLKGDIEKVDILTDFDEVMIKEHSAYSQIFSYFLYLGIYDRINFLGKSLRKYFDYKKNGDVSSYYELFAGCPLEVLDRTVCKYKENEKWSKLVDKLKLKKIGVVSRNNYRIISRYLNLKKLEEQSIETSMVVANNPESVNNIYTGDVEIKVNNNNLTDFVREKDYICGEEEKKILEGSGVYFMKVEGGLYVCSKKKTF